MEQLLQKIPPSVLGIIVVAGVIMLMNVAEPPLSVCDTQLESINQVLETQFYEAREEGWSYKSGLKDKYLSCLQANSSGGCYKLFKRYGVFEKQIRKIPKECGDHAKVAALKKNFHRLMMLVAQIGWGEKPPETLYEKRGWLDESTLGLFCRMQRQYRRLYGRAVFKQFRESVMITLPGAKDLKRKEMWEKSLFSLPCGPYL